MNGHLVLLLVRFVLGLGLCLGLVLRQTTPASAAQTCYVKAGAAGTGGSWANAYGSLQSALANVACTEIWVAKGTYKPTADTDRTVSFVLKSGVALYGGFKGTETLLSQRNPAANPTILSGEIGAAGNSDNSYHVVVGSQTNSTATLDGFTIMAGNANGPYPDGEGGGLYGQDDNMSLTNVTFSGNSAAFGGGMSTGGSPSLVNVNFNGNSAIYQGGGMSTGGSPTLVNVNFSGNSAGGDPAGGYGGGMAIDGNPVLSNVTFSANNAYVGGGLFGEASNMSLTNVTFSGNHADRQGGGMSQFDGHTSLMNVTFSGNSATSGGGGVFLAEVDSSTSLTVTNSILYGDSGGEIGKDSFGDPVLSVTFSIVQGGWSGIGNLNANPRLKPLGNYGGFTRTRPLGLGSPAIDHGTNTGCPARDQRGVSRPQDGDLNSIATCDMGATESRLFRKPLPSIGSQDGWILESSETSGTGGSVHSTEPDLIVGDSTDKRQARGILSFNTASLPDTAQLVSAVLRLKLVKLSSGLANPFSQLGNLLVDVRKGPFGTSSALQKTDFEAQASKLAAMTILNNPVGGWYSRAVPATSLPYINKAGLTQFRLRFSLDDNNDAVSNYIKFYSGNAAAASRPVLVVKYYVP